MTEKIEGFKGQYAFLSNFYRIEGAILQKSLTSQSLLPYTTSEHLYQALKFPYEHQREIIRKTDTPAKAKAAAKLMKAHIDKDWDDKKLRMMLYCVDRKFREFPALRDALVVTGSAELIEVNTWKDRYWGVYKDEGKNMLGKILMLVRADLASHSLPNL